MYVVRFDRTPLEWVRASTMREIERIARLLEQTFEGRAYYGPSVLDALKDVSAVTAGRKPDGGAHNIWDLVAHLAAELRYARALLEGSAGPWIEATRPGPLWRRHRQWNGSRRSAH